MSKDLFIVPPYWWPSINDVDTPLPHVSSFFVPSVGIFDQLPTSFMDSPLLHVARKTNGFDLRGDLSLGDGQGVLKMVAVTYSKKASNWRRDKELCSVSKGLILGIPTDKTETKFQSEQKSNFRDSNDIVYMTRWGISKFLFQTRFWFGYGLQLCRLQLPLLLVYSVEQNKQQFFVKKARTELNWEDTHSFIFILITLIAVVSTTITQATVEKNTHFKPLLTHTQICLRCQIIQKNLRNPKNIHFQVNYSTWFAMFFFFHFRVKDPRTRSFWQISRGFRFFQRFFEIMTIKVV